MTRTNKLGTSSFAILGLLAQRPWSAYELAGNMKISVLQRLWPRATSEVYKEPKKLVAAGFASVHKERNGGRQRSVYQITEEGRQALAEWLSTAANGMVYQDETLLKLCFSPAEADIIEPALKQVIEQSLDEARAMLAVYEQVLDTDAPAPGVPMRRMAISYIRHILEARIEWAETMLESKDWQTQESEIYRREQQHLTALLNNR